MVQPHPNLVDLSGRRFGRLSVIRLHPVRTKCRNARWVCLCDCGNEAIVSSGGLKDDTRSCGCLRRLPYNKTHGATRTRLHTTWKGIHQRCRDLKNKAYGGRGIKVCKAWQRFEPFRDWALSHGYQDDLTIDRINNDGNYTPSNCRWITLSQNIAKQFSDKRNKAKLTHNFAS